MFLSSAYPSGMLRLAVEQQVLFEFPRAKTRKAAAIPKYPDFPRLAPGNPGSGCGAIKWPTETAEPTGLEPATSAVTGQRSNQLS